MTDVIVDRMEARAGLPVWLAVTPAQLRDLSCLAMRLVVEDRSRLGAGMVAVSFWLLAEVKGPSTGREDGPGQRDVALAELCAAEALVDDGHPAPPLHDVCQLLEVPYRPPIEVDAGYARGVWLTLRWVLGQSARPPMDLPLRRFDGGLMGEVDIYAVLVERGCDSAEARRAAVGLAADSRRLAELVEDCAARLGSARQ